MIAFKITMNVIPEKQMEIMQTLLPMIEPTARSAGCLSFSAFCDIEDKNRFTLLGDWKTRKDLEQYIASHRFSVLLGTKALLCEPLDAQIFTISGSEGMNAILLIRAKNKTNAPPIDGQRSLTK